MYDVVDETIQRITEESETGIPADKLGGVKVRDVYFDMFCAPLGEGDNPNDLDSLEGPQIEGLICEEMDPNITFKDLMQGMTEGKDFYEMINVGDSDVRMRIFEVISDTLNIDFDILYDSWMYDFEQPGRNNIKRVNALQQLKDIVAKL